MIEIEKELIEFLPESDAKSFTEGLTNELSQYSIKKSPSIKKIQSIVQKAPVSTTETSKQTSRTGNGIKQSQNSRLLTTAIKSSSGNQNNASANSSTSADKKRKSMDSTTPSPGITESRVVSLDTDRGIYADLFVICFLAF